MGTKLGEPLMAGTLEFEGQFLAIFFFEAGEIQLDNEMMRQEGRKEEGNTNGNQVWKCGAVNQHKLILIGGDGPANEALTPLIN